MKAVAVDAVAVSLAGVLDGETVLETSCADYEAYAALPRVVDFEGTVCVKTGWNSDTGRACYKSGVPFARAVRS